MSIKLIATSLVFTLVVSCANIPRKTYIEKYEESNMKCIERLMDRGVNSLTAAEICADILQHRFEKEE